MQTCLRSHTDPVYHTETRLADGRPALLIDPGSVGNLCGDTWASSVAEAAVQNGYRPEYKKRDRPLNVRGVGNGSQVCTNDCFLPVGLITKDGKKAVHASFATPCVQNSTLPGLMGRQALRSNKAVIDFNKMEMYFMGEADYELERSMPPGTDSFQLELAPSGHIVLPCSEFAASHDLRQDDHTLTLITQLRSANNAIPPPPPRPPRVVTFEEQ